MVRVRWLMRLFVQCCLPSKMAERQMPPSGPSKMTLGRDVKCMEYGVAFTTSGVSIWLRHNRADRLIWICAL